MATREDRKQKGRWAQEEYHLFVSSIADIYLYSVGESAHVRPPFSLLSILSDIHSLSFFPARAGERKKHLLV